MNIDKLIKYGSVVSAGLSIITFTISVREIKRAKKAARNCAEAIDYLAYKTPVIISNNIVKAAAEKAADKAAEEAINAVREDISKDVHRAVNDIRGEIEEEIRKKLSESVADNINIDEIKMTVTNRACSKIVDKVLAGFGKYAEPIAHGVMRALADKGWLR